MWDFISSESIASLDKRASSPAFKLLKNNVDTAHGVLMGLAVVLFLPLGALLMRLPGSKNMLWVHAACQLFGLIVLILGFAMGVWTSIIHTEVCLYCSLAKFIHTQSTLSGAMPHSNANEARTRSIPIGILSSAPSSSVSSSSSPPSA